VIARLAACLLCVVTTHAAIAAPDEGESPDRGRPPPPPPTTPAARGTVLVGSGAAWRWQLVTAPRIALQIGALAVSGLDVAAGRALAPVAVLGEPAPEPRGWPHDVDGAAAISAISPPAADQRIAAAFGVTTFSLGPADQGYEMLELRLRYEDGVAVWLNGVEVVRQALPRGATTTLAVRSHGPEWETFGVPVGPGLLRRGDNVLAVRVHPSGRRHAPLLAAELIGRRERGIVRGPILAEAGATTAKIAVETDPGVEAVLEWGASGGELAQRRTSPAGRHHVFELTGLPPSRGVSYRVTAGATRSPPTAFRTQPGPGAVIRIGVYGDVRGGHATHARLVGHMLREGLDLVAVTGDMVLDGADQADWQRFFAVTRELLAQVPYWPAVGNHDLGWDGADQARRAEAVFALPPGPPDRPAGAYWYSRDVADVHLVFLDSNAYDRAEQEAWLDADLAAARARRVRAILVLTHDGPFARGHHGGNAVARARYVPILAKHRADLLFAGHDHLYQRGELGGVRYVVTGGGGASLYNIRCGVPGRPRCALADGMIAIAREHHYAVLTIARDLELCVRRADGTLIEKCVRYRLAP
jgi:3',5'-cyclic AMP phosphodiesterase CpdA